MHFLHYRATNGQTLFQVIFPTGIKVELERNYWGIDVTIYAPQAEKEANEDGLCTYLPTKGDINTFGNSQRQEYLIKILVRLWFMLVAGDGYLLNCEGAR